MFVDLLSLTIYGIGRYQLYDQILADSEKP